VLAGKKSAAECALIEKFALPLGIAFQLRDDLLGVFGSEAVIGKSAESDLAEGKYTMLVQKTVEMLEPVAQEDFTRRISLPDNLMTEEDIGKLREYIESSGAKAFVRNRITELYETSVNAIRQTGAAEDVKALLLDIAGMINKVDV
ncbi:MAG TPA: polyprenyl synthetase family protein, partial [Spirochaetota bacterium]|nr:polyprenyl synthetase family protein [Spirochaetota bacterium]